MFANSQMGGLDFGFPDVCLTPIPPVVVPIPYPNLAVGCMGVPAAYKIMFGGTPTHNMSTIIPMTNGDNTGVNMGVASGMVMGPDRTIIGSFTTLVGGMPVKKMCSLMGHNGMSLNIPGMALIPSQFKVLVLK